MTTAWDLLAASVRTDAGRPRVVHYDLSPGGMRVELSGKALANWVAKVANLLVDECDVEPGDAVVLDLPPVHWRTAVWVLGCWAAGAVPVAAAGPDAAGADGEVRLVVRVADDAVTAAAPVPDGALLGVLALPALARDAGDLPAGALDLNADVMGQPDTFLAPPDEGPDLPGPRRADGPVTGAAPAGPAPDPATPAAAIGTVDELASLLHGTVLRDSPRPLVLVSGPLDAETLARIAADERL